MIASRIEISEALCRTFAVEQNVDDDIAALVARAFQLQAKRLAQEAAAAVGGDHPVRLHRVIAVRRVHRQPGAVLTRVDGHQAVLPAYVDQILALLGGVQQELFDAVLREIDHRRQFLIFVRRHFEMQHFRLAIKAAPACPGQTSF